MEEVAASREDDVAESILDEVLSAEDEKDGEAIDRAIADRAAGQEPVLLDDLVAELGLN